MPDLTTLADTLRPSGHALQARIYAEDPYKEFQPCAGLLSKVSFPPAGDTIEAPSIGTRLRVDHWIDSGLEVSPYYDPMLGKMIVLPAAEKRRLPVCGTTWRRPQFTALRLILTICRPCWLQSR